MFFSHDENVDCRPVLLCTCVVVGLWKVRFHQSETVVLSLKRLMVCCIKGNGYENSVEKREFSKVVLVKGIYDD